MKIIIYYDEILKGLKSAEIFKDSVYLIPAFSDATLGQKVDIVLVPERLIDTDWCRSVCIPQYKYMFIAYKDLTCVNIKGLKEINKEANLDDTPKNQTLKCENCFHNSVCKWNMKEILDSFNNSLKEQDFDYPKIDYDIDCKHFYTRKV